MSEYLVIYEPAGDGSWSARAADLPVFVSGDTREEAEAEIRAAIATHVDALRQRGQAVPEPRSVLGSVTV